MLQLAEQAAVDFVDAAEFAVGLVKKNVNTVKALLIFELGTVFGEFSNIFGNLRKMFRNLWEIDEISLILLFKY